VIQIDVVKSIPELDQAAIDAVRQWRYETTLLNGEAVEVAMNVAVNFTLR
jgi:protein TonB